MKKDFKLREYQEQISKDASLILDKYGFVYLAMQVRTGKTHTALNIAHTRGKQNVLFVTKKKAIYSIQEDYDMIDAGFKMMTSNGDMGQLKQAKKMLTNAVVGMLFVVGSYLIVVTILQTFGLDKDILGGIIEI